jgi:hypothetical protein
VPITIRSRWGVLAGITVILAFAVIIPSADSSTRRHAEAASPASLTVILEVVPVDQTRFTFDDAGGADLFQGLPRGQLILDDDPRTAGFPSQRTFEGLANNNLYFVTQSAVPGYDLSVACSNDTGGRSILTPLADGISFRLRDNDALTCTFTNTNLTVPPPADTTPPLLTLSPDTTVEATGPSTIVTFEATATDLVDGALPVTCEPPSGVGFPLGDTAVTCTAEDAAGNVASGSFTVTVEDTTPPVLSLPAAIRLDESPAGDGSAVATFDASAFDVVDGGTAVTCAPSSGAAFPLGVTRVECASTDTAGNSSAGSFDIEVVAVPWSLTIELEVRHQQPTNVPITVMGDQGRGLILDDPVDDDRDGIESLDRLDGTGNGVALEVVAGPLPGFETESIRCDGGAPETAGDHVSLLLDAGDDVRCRITLLDTDLDDDGLTDDLEAILGTDPARPDTDGDGVGDGEEILIRNTDPLAAAANRAEDAPPPPRTFTPPLPPSGAALAIYGGGTLGELLADLEAAGAATASLTTAHGSTAVLVVSDLAFVIESFVEGYFGVEALASPTPSYLDLPIEAGMLLFVRLS